MVPKLQNHSEQLSIWRFGVISPLLHLNEGDSSLKTELERLAGQSFLLPGGSRKSFSPDTLRHWLSLYKKEGLCALESKTRKDTGKTSVPEQLQQNLRELRELHPVWNVTRILNELVEQNKWDGICPSRTSIYRFTKAQNLNRGSTIAPCAGRPFQYSGFGQLWMADFLHGPKVRMGRVTKKCYLHAIIDDASRFIVCAKFHVAENTHALISDLMLACRRFGLPQRFYTDNGAAFQSHHLARVAARLQISLPHTPPGRPQGRGKVERLFRTIREQLLTGLDTYSLDALNGKLQSWISNYHCTIHSTLKMSPLDKMLQIKRFTRNLDDVKDIEALFRMEEQRTVYSDGCVKVGGNRYEVPDALPGTKVVVFWLPWDLSMVWIGDKMVAVRPLNREKNAERFSANPNSSNRSIES